MYFYKGTAGMKQYANKGISPGRLPSYSLLDEMAWGCPDAFVMLAHDRINYTGSTRNLTTARSVASVTVNVNPASSMDSPSAGI